jgi:UDPglucose 6-dehydrogenase
VELVNQRQKHVLFDKIRRHYGGNLRGKVIALWGLSFKPNTDDMREASSRALIEDLWSAGARVQAYDPVASDEARRIYGERPELRICARGESALEGADVLAIVTEWREFRSPDFALIKQTLRDPAIFDGRNLYDPRVVRQHGLKYFAIGRGDPLP